MPSSRARRAAARKAAAGRRRRAARGLGLGAGVAIAVAVAAATGVVGGGGSPGDGGHRTAPEEVRSGSKPLEGRTGLVRITDEPTSYRLVYRVETFGGGDRVVTRDVVEIRRPFDGRTRKFVGADPGDAVRSEQLGGLGRIFVPRTGKSTAVLLETGPALAPSDLRIGPVLDDLLASGRVEAREWRTVAGRPCQVLRFGGPISSGTIAPVLDPGVEYADACVSLQGLVLEELWVEAGTVQRRRLATTVEVGPKAEIDDATFTPPSSSGEADALPVEQGGGSFRALDPSSAYAAPFWVLDAAPLPTALGRWAVVTPAGGDPEDEETKDKRIGSVVDVWQSGLDVVILEQGSTSGGVRAFVLGDGPRVDVEGLGAGEFVADLRTSEVRFQRSGGYFLRVRGTVGRARLEELARQLRRTEGGSGLVYLDGGDPNR